MSLSLHQPESRSTSERLDFAKGIVRAEASVLAQVADRLDETFLDVVDLLRCCSGSAAGRVAISGTGKSLDIAQKITGTFNSTGTRAYLLDSTRAMHGDLGMLHPEDVLLLLSHSGESAEIVCLLDPVRPLCRTTVALTGNAASTLARKADYALVYGPLGEVCPLGLAPSASTTAMIALGDALAFSLSTGRDFGAEDFAKFHPAGSLGRKLMTVDALMRKDDCLRVSEQSRTVREVFATSSCGSRRTGAVILIDEEGRLTGIFTDSDLARLIELRRDSALDRPIREVMTANPHCVEDRTRLPEAIGLLVRHKISELPVIDGERRPVGMLDITDLLGVVSAEERKALDLPERIGA